MIDICPNLTDITMIQLVVKTTSGSHLYHSPEYPARHPRLGETVHIKSKMNFIEAVENTCRFVINYLTSSQDFGMTFYRCKRRRIVCNEKLTVYNVPQLWVKVQKGKGVVFIPFPKAVNKFLLFCHLLKWNLAALQNLLQGYNRLNCIVSRIFLPPIAAA